MNSKIISTQRYTDDTTIEAKRGARDYTVSLSPAFALNGELVQLVLDGHHSLAAAIMDDAPPEYITLTASQVDTVALLEAGKVEDFLLATWIDSDPYDVATGHDL